jgi:hypothetical protein
MLEPENLVTIALIFVWQFGSLMSNTTLKVVLSSTPYPLTWNVLQFGLQAAMGAILLKIQNTHFPDLFTQEALSILGLQAIFQLISRFLHDYGLSLAPISFVHTVKVLINFSFVNFPRQYSL